MNYFVQIMESLFSFFTYTIIGKISHFTFFSWCNFLRSLSFFFYKNLTIFLCFSFSSTSHFSHLLYTSLIDVALRYGSHIVSMCILFLHNLTENSEFFHMPYKFAINVPVLRSFLGLYWINAPNWWSPTLPFFSFFLEVHHVHGAFYCSMKGQKIIYIIIHLPNNTK